MKSPAKKASSSSAIPLKAVPFITIDEKQRFAVVPETRKLFEDQNEPFAVVVLTGQYRTGKSYLLNQLIQEKDAFTVDPTTQACTKGLWVAKKVLGTVSTRPGEAPDSKPRAVYFIDCEGFGGIEKSFHFDVKVFARFYLRKRSEIGRSY